MWINYGFKVIFGTIFHILEEAWNNGQWTLEKHDKNKKVSLRVHRLFLILVPTAQVTGLGELIPVLSDEGDTVIEVDGDDVWTSVGDVTACVLAGDDVLGIVDSLSSFGDDVIETVEADVETLVLGFVVVAFIDGVTSTSGIMKVNRY